MSSFFGYGSTGHSDTNNDGNPSIGSGSASNRSSVANPQPPPLQQHQSTASDMTVISADDVVPNPAATNEKTPLQYQAYPNNGTDDYGKENQDQDHGHDHEDDGHDHAPGERCSLPPLIQPLVSHENHGMVESLVVKVMDSADVTQKTVFYFWDEWKAFVNRGNVIDLGIGVVLGGAFSDIIDSFVIDIMTPPLSLWATGTNLENSFIILKHGRTPGKIYNTYLEAQEDGAVTENTGHFLKACLNFLIIAFFLFWIVKGKFFVVARILKEKIRPPPKEKECAWCKENIALDAFRCKFCQSFVKDIPGIEDAGVGMFVTIKRPSAKYRPSMDPSFDQNHYGLDHNALTTGMAAGVIAASKERDNKNSNSNSRSSSNNNISSSSSQPRSQSHPTSNGNTGKSATTGPTSSSSSAPVPPPHATRSGSTVGPSDGKKIAAGLAKMDGAQK
ncbi:hypothetical protein KI688_000373 [Linnemannia hyalina]|uniref:Large-conductance mechanosensitive channel n=1 Tax=Linnemannia hyalina TaxID=64524 RepID=A0A9P7Y4H8_9FUNG|nr:hypothetical protein KI688_000373 [Linnemannia hyalina]